MSTSFLNIDASGASDSVEFKAISGQIGIDKAQGIVECFVSGIGNKDSVGDIVIPGAFDSSLKRRKPRVVWGHDWNQPIGKVIEIYEVTKSDSRLPEKMKRAGVGGLYAKVQFNLNTERGREAFANVAFYGMEQEWSIGYKTLVADFDPARQANVLKELELYEISPVLHGANQLTGTISVKDDSENAQKKGWQWMEETDETEKKNKQRASMSMLGRSISTALGKPVDIIDVSGDTVVFQTGENMMWRSTVSVEDGDFVLGKPQRVRKVPSYVDVAEETEEVMPSQSAPDTQEEEERPASMDVKEDAEEPEGVRDAEEGMSFQTPDMALAWSKTLGCSGYHSHGGGYMPCEDHDTYMAAVKKYDGNANINSSNNFLAGAEVEEAKSEDGGCSCTSEKGHGYRVVRNDEDDDRQPEYLRDPMTTLLMAYNNMLPIMGAGELRSDTLELIAKLEKFMTEQREVPMTTPATQERKGVSGFYLDLNYEGDMFDAVKAALEGVPVFAEKAESGTAVHFSEDMSRDDLMEKVAYALAELDFDLKVTPCGDVDNETGEL